MTDALIVLGIIDILIVAAIVSLARSARGRHDQDSHHDARDQRCIACGKSTIYQAPLCPKCAQRLRESHNAQKPEGR